MRLSPVDPAKPLPVKFQEIAREGHVAIVRLIPLYNLGDALTARKGRKNENPHTWWTRLYPQEARHQRDQSHYDVSRHLSTSY
jgi:hypothetical protein